MGGGIHTRLKVVGVLKCSLKLLAEDFLVKHVHNTQASAVHLVHALDRHRARWYHGFLPSLFLVRHQDLCDKA